MFPRIAIRHLRASPIVAVLLCLLLLRFPVAAFAEESGPHRQNDAAAPAEEFKRFTFVFEPDAYYADVNLIIALTKAPIPQLGELTEAEIYKTLLSRAALLPQFLVLEASVNPMPFIGTYIKDQERELYDRAQISGSLNVVTALTAGFEEPYALSLLAGNVANFYLPGSEQFKGLGYSGYLFSAGNYHIRNNELIRDDWQEYEWKIKGDRKSPVRKLSWSFRIGAKLHGNPDITDSMYVSLRRSRVDYKPVVRSLFNNSGFEYTYDMDSRSLSAIRHYFFVDKKWPIENRQMAFSLALGFVWESSRKYTGELAAEGEGTNTQIIVRPNIEF